MVVWARCEIIRLERSCQHINVRETIHSSLSAEGAKITRYPQAFAEDLAGPLLWDVRGVKVCELSVLLGNGWRNNNQRRQVKCRKWIWKTMEVLAALPCDTESMYLSTHV
jgi:hypothetical protein